MPITSVLTRPSNTTPYTVAGAPVIIASSASAGSIIVPSFTVPNKSGGKIRRLRLTTSNIAWVSGGGNFAIKLWSAAPTYANGDGGYYNTATGASGYLGGSPFIGLTEIASDGLIGIYDISLSTGVQMVSGLGVGSIGAVVDSGQQIFWDLAVNVENSSVTPLSSEEFTLSVEIE